MFLQALEDWSRRGEPEDQVDWLYRTTRNLVIDALSWERIHAKASSPLEAHFAGEIGDEPPRLLFVCCPDTAPAESRVALAPRTLCGFSTAEIARAMVTTDANVRGGSSGRGIGCAGWSLPNPLDSGSHARNAVTRISPTKSRGPRSHFRTVVPRLLSNNRAFHHIPKQHPTPLPPVKGIARRAKGSCRYSERS